MRFVIALVALAIIVVAVVISTRRGMAMADTPDAPTGPGAAVEQATDGADLTSAPRTEHTA